jgi:hypothetical protein
LAQYINQDNVVKVRIQRIAQFRGDRSDVEIEGDASLRAVRTSQRACPGSRAAPDEEDHAGHRNLHQRRQETGPIQRVPADGAIRILPACGGGSLRDAGA